MGTAESLIGVLDGLEHDAFQSGLATVPHVLPRKYCWLGGISASGGSIEWLRNQLGNEPISYEEVGRLIDNAGPEPTGIVYFPYLSGSGAPCHDHRVRAAFVGVSAHHGRGHLLRAAMEGTALEALAIQEAANRLTGATIPDVVAVGGSTRNRDWMQIKADVSGIPHRVAELDEAAVRGAAFTAAVGTNLMTLEELPLPSVQWTAEPDAERHRRYRSLYETVYRPLQGPLRAAAAQVTQGTERLP
jgi:xylulokinase